jgi:hypothetical protein
MKTTPITWAVAALLCLILGASHLLDGPSELDAISDTATDLIDARQQAVVALRDVNRVEE